MRWIERLTTAMRSYMAMRRRTYPGKPNGNARAIARGLRDGTITAHYLIDEPSATKWGA